MEFYGWRAFYTDGRIFTSSNHDWEDLPWTGVLGVVAYYEKPYREIVNSGDWYWLDENGEPTKKMTHEEWDKWVPKPEHVPDEMLKRGEAIPDDEWSRVRDQMFESREWP